MKYLAFTPSYAYLLIFIFGLHAVGFFPYCIDLPIYGGEIINYGKPSQSIEAYPITIGGTDWYPTWGSVILLIGIILMYWELYKSTRTSDLVTMDHALSTVTFIIYFGFFLGQPWAGNSLFLTLTLMALLDVVAGFSITLAAARRDVSIT
jgi:hypothetical protein